jgi:excisionase family DNA binding protein
MEGFLSVQQVAENWNISTRRVQKMCSDGRIPGVEKFGKSWVIPENAERPADGRVTSGKYKNWGNKQKTRNCKIKDTRVM